MRDSENTNLIRILELEKRVQMHIEASKAAVALAANDLRTRLDAMNEFRNALKDQAAAFIPRQEVEKELRSIQKEIASLEISKAVLEEKASQHSVNVSLVFSVLGIGLSLLALIFRALGK